MCPNKVRLFTAEYMGPFCFEVCVFSETLPTSPPARKIICFVNGLAGRQRFLIDGTGPTVLPAIELRKRCA